MPSFVLHSNFSDELYYKLPRHIQVVIDKDKMATYAQGPDPFFTYHLLDFLNKDKKITQEMGNILHNQKVAEFFELCGNYIMDHNLHTNKDVMSFYYAWIGAHYIPDSIIHPYVYNRTGIFNPNDKDTFKYNGLHFGIEKMFDYYIAEEHLKLIPGNKLDIREFSFRNSNTSEELINMLNYVGFQLFGFPALGNKYKDALKEYEVLTTIACKDKYGLKLPILSLIDIIKGNSSPRLTPLSTIYPKDKNMRNALNLDNEVWNHPSDLNDISNKSVPQLYEDALKKATSVISNVDIAICGELDHSTISTITEDNSYDTGKNCKIYTPNTMIHFANIFTK